MSRPAPGEVLAWVVRGQMVESVHTGHLVALDASGRDVLRLGEPEQQIYPRSCLKPLQAVGMLRAGVSLTTDQLALACASHNGEERHREVTLGILESVGLDATALANTPDLPLEPAAALAWQRGGRGPEPIAQNCSGKHAAMVATCVAAGWPVAGYLDAEHPLQRHLLAVIAELTQVAPAHVAVDGCGAPQPATTVRGLAGAFARIAAAEEGTVEHRVAEAMRAHPFLVAGTGREDTEAMRAVPGLILKGGADGVHAGALPDGRALAFKVSDGAARPRPVVLRAVLRELGVEPAEDWAWERVPVLGHGEPVGAVYPAFGADALAFGGAA